MSKLHKSLEDQRKLLTDPIKYVAAQNDVHYLVISLAGNGTLALTARLLQEVIRLHESAVNSGREYDPLRAAALKEHKVFVSILEERRDSETEAFWKAHLQTNAKNMFSKSGPQTVLDLYNDDLSRQQLRFGL